MMPKKKQIDKKVTPESASLAIIKKAIAKKYGPVMAKLSDHPDIVVSTVSTGSISLDLALGNGGWALGRIYEISGPNSSGKSTLAVHAIIEAQKRGMKCCYIDAEHAVDPGLYKSYGVDTDKLDLIQGYDGESNLDILEKLTRSGAYSVAVVDSVSALIPRAEADADIEKESIALLARLMSKATRRLVPIANETGTLVIFINQLRMKVGGYGNPETTSGGEALGFYTTGRVKVRGPEAKARIIKDDTTDEPIGHKCDFEVAKNKLSIPFKKASMRLIYTKGYDQHWETLDLATSLGIVDKAGAWYKYDNKNIAQGEINAVSYFKENEDVYNEIRGLVIDQVGLKEIYEQNS